MTFSLDDVPDQTGKNIIITGASSGIGLAAARMLALKGGHVIMACRNLQKAQPLADAINTDAAACGGKATVMRLDTTDLDTIDDFARDLRISWVDSVLLNAGIMAVPYREIPTRSAKHPKMESQMACNVVGHFYLVHTLTALLRASVGVRVVWVSSAAAERAPGPDAIDYDVLCAAAPAKYSTVGSYAQSKLGDLLLAHEMQRRCSAAGISARVVAAHPGYSRTQLQEKHESFLLGVFIWLSRFLSMAADGGGLVLAVAGTVPDDQVPEKPYFAPSGIFSMRGPPTAQASFPANGRDDAQAKRLWEMCEELCGVKTDI